MPSHYPVIIIGAGPAGLSAALFLSKKNLKPLIIEKNDKAGGISRTEIYRGYRFDIGGHRFFTKNPAVQNVWHETLGVDLRPIKRASRIINHGKFYHYPLEISNVLKTAGYAESFKIVLSYLKEKGNFRKKTDNLEEWLIHHFGKRLYETFFKSYTEKVWGIRCDQIDAQWAAQRIKGLSIGSLIGNSIFNTNPPKSLIRNFFYPRLGSGMMWEKMSDIVKSKGAEIRYRSEVVKIYRNTKSISGILCNTKGVSEEFTCDHLISTMSLPDLVRSIEPPPPHIVRKSADTLEFRAFILVGLILKGKCRFYDNWIYIHNPHTKACRIQIIPNWSSEMTPSHEMTTLGVEYFCEEGDITWSLSDKALIDRAFKEVNALGLLKNPILEDGVVIRQSQAYPVYRIGFENPLDTIRHFLDGLGNLQSVGRNGLHRYNNMDHSMIMGFTAAKIITGENHNVWKINKELVYQEI